MRKKITIEFLIEGPPFDRICHFYIKEIKSLTKKQIEEEYKKIEMGEFQRYQNIYYTLDSMADKLKEIEKSGEEIKLRKKVKKYQI